MKVVDAQVARGGKDWMPSTTKLKGTTAKVTLHSKVTSDDFTNWLHFHQGGRIFEQLPYQSAFSCCFPLEPE